MPACIYRSIQSCLSMLSLASNLFEYNYFRFKPIKKKQDLFLGRKYDASTFHILIPSVNSQKQNMILFSKRDLTQVLF